MKDMNKLLTFLPIVVLAIGLIGWTLTLRADVTISLIENEQRTIMADHSGFSDVLEELGKAGLLPAGERREYGNYGK